jgi:hypothetical protein
MLLLTTFVSASPLAESGGTMTATVGTTTVHPGTGGGGGSGGSSGGHSSLKQCNDEKDNDGDGLVDLDDPGCISYADNTENTDYEDSSQVIADIEEIEKITDITATVVKPDPTLMDILGDLVDNYNNSNRSTMESIIQKIKNFYRRVSG